MFHLRLVAALAAAIVAAALPASAAQYLNPNGSVSTGLVNECVDAAGKAVVCSSKASVGMGNVGGKTVESCVTPTITAANAYGTNFVVGGLLTFPTAFTATGTGILQSVTVNIRKVESGGFTFTPLIANPSSTTFTDAAVAAINTVDAFAVRAPVALVASSVLGSHTSLNAVGIGHAIAPGSATLYGVLTANAALTNQFAAGDVQVCVSILLDL